MCPKVKTLSPISDPGTRPSPHGGVVLQFQRRSQQLEGIADEITGIFNENLPDNDDASVRLDKDEAHRIKGYMEQLRIIADELNKAGK